MDNNSKSSLEIEKIAEVLNFDWTRFYEDEQIKRTNNEMRGKKGGITRYNILFC